MKVKVQIAKPSRLLIVHLKRFSLFNQKNSVEISDFQKLTLDTVEGTAEFQLIGTVEHIGNSLSRGHYVTHAIGFDANVYKFSDETIELSTFDDIDGSSIYICIYKLIEATANDKMQENIALPFDETPTSKVPLNAAISSSKLIGTKRTFSTVAAKVSKNLKMFNFN